MAVDWYAIKSEYLAGNESYVALASKYGVHKSTIANRASKEGWVEQREQIRRTNANQIEQMRANVNKEKMEIAAEAANAKIDCETLIWKITRRKLQILADETPIEDVETADLRRLQQVYSEMSLISVSNIAGMTEEDDPLTKALNEIAEKLDKGNTDTEQ